MALIEDEVESLFYPVNRMALENSEEILPCDLLLIAAGFVGVPDEFAKEFSLERTNRNTLVTQPDSHHIDGKCFACGDCRRGQSLVVWGLQEGRSCAHEDDEYLMRSE